MSNSYIFSVPCDNAGDRIDKFLAICMPELTRSAVQKIIENNGVFVDGNIIGKSYKCKSFDEITITVPDAQPMEALPENIPLDIVYEDSDLLVVNKPKGMVVHPACGNWQGTLVNALLYHCGDSLSGINGVIRPGIVHRIDKDTSGLLMVAKNDFAHLHLANQIKDHSFARAYETVVYGNIKDDSFTVNQPIGRNSNDRKKMAVTLKNSKNATTHFQVLNRYNSFTHLRCQLETGRTHQIRVHTSHIGHPVAGDSVYGPKKIITSLQGQCLHAKHIGFVHPRTNQWLEFETQLPDYFINFLNTLKN